MRFYFQKYFKKSRVMRGINVKAGDLTVTTLSGHMEFARWKTTLKVDGKQEKLKLYVFFTFLHWK